jgi:hypothetical protein
VKCTDYTLRAIDMPATDYNAASSKGGLILVTVILSMLIAIGTLFVYGMKGKDGN